MKFVDGECGCAGVGVCRTASGLGGLEGFGFNLSPGRLHLQRMVIRVLSSQLLCLKKLN